MKPFPCGQDDYIEVHCLSNQRSTQGGNDEDLQTSLLQHLNDLRKQQEVYFSAGQRSRTGDGTCKPSWDLLEPRPA